MKKIILISQELDEQMNAMESNRGDIVAARELLEKSLTFQFQRLALGMCSYASLYGGSLSNYCLIPLKNCFPQVDSNLSLESIRQNIAKGVIQKEWEVISVSQLNSIEIRLYYKKVKLWNDIEINEQLALLGSSLRFYFAGNDQLSIAQIKNLIGYNQDSFALDGRFIFGSIGFVSATYFGPLFHFIKELAVSPYFSESEPGFTIGDTTVLRDTLLEGESKDNALIHELVHAFAYVFKDGLPFGRANWRRCIERDICRYLIDSHSFNEIEDAIGVYQVLSDTILNHITDGNIEAQTKLKNLGFSSLSHIFYDLVDVGKICKKNGKYYSPIYRGGSKWAIF